MVKKFISPSLADLSQDIAGPVPVDIIKAWIESNGTKKDAERILDPYKVHGTVVSSDTAGLSKLSREKELLEVLKIVSDPKEIIHGLGKAVGGVAIGRWIADNTQMFYDDRILVPSIVRAMHEANNRIIESCLVKVGFGIHSGDFLNIGNGIYGDEADFVEEYAENKSEGGEILISESVTKELVDDNSFIFELAEDLSGSIEDIYRLKNAKRFPDMEIVERDYPLYFDKRFFSLLKKFDAAGVRDIIYKDYLKSGFAVLIQRGPIEVESEMTGLLDNLIVNAAFSATLKRVASLFSIIKEIKIAGGLAIFIFEAETAEEALEFSRTARLALENEKISCTIGIESGDVLVFPLEDGTWEIAGSPVNIASKQAQDFGKLGNIYITKNAANDLKLPKCKEYEVEVSHIVLMGYVF